MVQLPKSLFLLALLLSSCSTLDQIEDTYEQRFSKDVAKIQDIQSQELKNVPIPQVSPVVAVYPMSFTDQTGQRKSNSEFALFSTAITQQPNALLIRALKHAGDGKFFRVVERVGLDNLTKERQLIRSAREQSANEEEKKKALRPLLFAGILIEGAVLSYEANLESGGSGARYLGIGASVQYREDNITISMRMVSVATGEVLLEVLSQKTIFSYGRSEDVFRFVEANTELVEVEFGNARNESSTIALMKAIEGGVLEIIETGYEKGFWVLQNNNEGVELNDEE
jgi:curli production assembly/transport component CsgG|tara:strand:- start:770 stop:1618 length:849 start_codon:yes stop_codon:yes gene_type:complete